MTESVSPWEDLDTLIEVADRKNKATNELEEGRILHHIAERGVIAFYNQVTSMMELVPMVDCGAEVSPNNLADSIPDGYPVLVCPGCKKVRRKKTSRHRDEVHRR